jgi:hypothetical protein
VEAQDLDATRVRTPRQEGRERVDRASRQRGVGVRLDVELHREPGRDEVEHLIDQERSLGGRSALAVEQPPREHIGDGPLVRPPGERGPERQVCVVQASERAVAREAHFSLNAPEWAPGERGPQCPPRGVRAVGAPTAVRDQRRLHRRPLRRITHSGVSSDGDRLVTRS